MFVSEFSLYVFFLNGIFTLITIGLFHFMDKYITHEKSTYTFNHLLLIWILFNQLSYYEFIKIYCV